MKINLLILIFALIGYNSHAQQLVKDIKPGYYGSSPRSFTSTNDILFFVADSSITGNNPQLWKTDGTTEGSFLVFDKLLAKGGPTIGMLSMGEYLYFGAYDDNLGFELHKTDGTTAGTILVKDIMSNNSPGFKHSNPSHLIAFKGKIFFSADDGINGRELWKSDGTEAGTVMVKDIRPGTYGSIETGNSTNFEILSNMLYFSAWDGTQTPGIHELWKTDGTEAGTVKIQTTDPGNVARTPENLTEFNGNLYFSASDKDRISGTELYKTDGTDAGTVLLKDIDPQNYESSYPQQFKVVNNILFFVAYDITNGGELWKTDGTASGTQIVKDINPGTRHGLILKSYLTSFNSNLFFAADDGVNGVELWKSDGTANGTFMVRNIVAGSANSYPEYLCEMNGLLYFRAGDAFDNVSGAELWKSDGTESGTIMVKDIVPGKYGSGPVWLFNHNGVLFFQASDVNGKELWKYDGANTRINETIKNSLLINIYPNPAKDFITIENKNSTISSTYVILNTVGQQVLSGQLVGETNIININKLSSGIYLLLVAGEEKHSYKLIKE